jgi:hypothetical protein
MGNKIRVQHTKFWWGNFSEKTTCKVNKAMTIILILDFVKYVGPTENLVGRGRGSKEIWSVSQTVFHRTPESREAVSGFRDRILSNGGITTFTSSLLSQHSSYLYTLLHYSSKSHCTCLGKCNYQSLGSYCCVHFQSNNMTKWAAVTRRNCCPRMFGGCHEFWFLHSHCAQKCWYSVLVIPISFHQACVTLCGSRG